MLLFFDTDTRSLIVARGNRSPVSRVDAQRGDAEELSIMLLKDGSPWQLSGSPAFSFVVKESGKFDGDALAAATSFSYDSARELYVAAVNYEGEDLDALLGVNGDDSDDEAFVDLNCQFGYQEDGSEAWQRSPVVPFRLFNNALRGDESAPPIANGNFIQYLPAVVGLTGGGATKLDGQATALLPAGWLVALIDDSVPALRHYELVSGTDAESAPDVIRPDDYDGTENAKVWKLRSAAALTIDLTADVTGVLPIANGGTGASSASAARTALGLGTIATQNANSVSLTGGSATGLSALIGASVSATQVLTTPNGAVHSPTFAARSLAVNADLLLYSSGTAVLRTVVERDLAQTLTNKTLDGTNNTLSNLSAAQINQSLPSVSHYTPAAATLAGHLSGIDTALGSAVQGSTGGTDNAILRADGTGGKTLQSANATINDSGNLTAVSFSTASGSFVLSSGGRIDLWERLVIGNAHVTSGQINVQDSGIIGFSSNGFWHGSLDAFFARSSAATIQMGANHATTPTAQTLKAHNVTTGTGASLTLAGGNGSVAKGHVLLDGGNRAAYNASPSTTDIRDILISHGLMAAS